MIVRIKRDDGLDDDWAMIEFHGGLVDDENEAENSYVGEVYYLKCGTPVMIIGNHMLNGKEVEMEKPMAVLEKQHSESDEHRNVEYKIRAIVRKKLLFKTRPKNLIF